MLIFVQTEIIFKYYLKLKLKLKFENHRLATTNFTTFGQARNEINHRPER